MDQTPENNGINLNDILLPKKEERTSASASRVNAGVLLEGEQKAELPKQEAAPIVPPKEPEGPVDVSNIAPLETYQRDIDTVISTKDVSAVSIAAAESERSMRGGSVVQKPRDWSWIGKFGIVIAGVALMLAAAGVLAFVFLRGVPAVEAPVEAASPFIGVDDTQVLVLTPDQLDHQTVIQNLASLKNNTRLSLGLIGRAYVVVSTSTVDNGNVPPPATIQTLLSAMAPNVPDDLLRALDPNYYLLGTHVFDENQEFLIMRTDSYEQAFSGMLAWERTMYPELSALFSRNPQPHINNGTASTTATTTPVTPAVFLSTPFRDQIVANHDVRAVSNDAGDILLLWTFLDRTTIVITTNENTLTELISRRGTFTGTP